MTREEAIAKAEKYNLQAEVIYCMDNLGCSPEEACTILRYFQCLSKICHNSNHLIVQHEFP